MSRDSCESYIQDVTDFYGRLSGYSSMTADRRLMRAHTPLYPALPEKGAQTREDGVEDSLALP